LGERHSVPLESETSVLCCAFSTVLLAGLHPGTGAADRCCLQRHLGGHCDLLHPALAVRLRQPTTNGPCNLDPALLRAMTRSYMGGMILYIAAFTLAFDSVVASLGLIVSLALLFVFPEPGERTGRGNASAKSVRTTRQPPRSRTKPSAGFSKASLSWRAFSCSPPGRNGRRRCGGSGRGSGRGVSEARS
jgi:hypothetical protein